MFQRPLGRRCPTPPRNLKHPQELGCIGEDESLAGDLDYQDFKRLPREDEAVVLRTCWRPSTYVSRIMGLGQFLKALNERMDRMTKKEICRALVQRGRTLPSVERREFLAEFESVPAAAPEWCPAHDDKLLIADIRAFVADLENSGKDYSRRPAFRREIEALVSADKRTA